MLQMFVNSNCEAFGQTTVIAYSPTFQVYSNYDSIQEKVQFNSYNNSVDTLSNFNSANLSDSDIIANLMFLSEATLIREMWSVSGDFFTLKLVMCCIISEIV